MLAEVSPLAERVVDWCITLGAVALVAGVLLAVWEIKDELKVREAARSAAGDAKDVSPSGDKSGDATAQGAISSSVKSVADLAAALKDLERSARFLVVGVAFFAIAAVTAGADAIADDTAPAAATSTIDGTNGG